MAPDGRDPRAPPATPPQAPEPRREADADPANRTQSPAMQRVWTLAARVADLDSTVLITGESGVGKEHLARWLHQASRRARHPFLAVNCGAFADTLLESELFGHARGAFTGALVEHAGVFEAAHGGTLFLDEVGEMSPAMQTRLLRVIQEREVRRVGETRVRAIDVRLIAATNRDLADAVTQDRFRADLWYRLRVIELHIPPLRDRPDDLRMLTTEFLQRTAARLGRPVEGYTPRALDRMLTHLWPGNIRELEHAIERACAVATGSYIDVEDLPDAVRGSAPDGQATGRPLVDHELAYIRAVVDRHHGRRRLAAQELGISVSTLNRRLRKATTSPTSSGRPST
jgi:two-component system response regulator HydG